MAKSVRVFTAGLCFLLVAVLPGCGREADRGESRTAVKVLWIGNSDTQSGPLYEIVARMVNGSDSGIKLESEASVFGGRDLNACVFHSVFTGKSPVGHPLRESMPYASMNPLVVEGARRLMTVTLDDETADFHQRAAWEPVQHYGKRGDIRVAIGRSKYRYYSPISVTKS